MKQKIILSISLILLVGFLGFVHAYTWGMGQFENQYAAPDLTNYSYKITYDISKPGWYLLPSRTFETIGSYSEGTDYSFLDSKERVGYRYVFSPFTKKYLRCTGVGDTLSCKEDFEDIAGKSESYLASLSQEELKSNYLNYLSLSADWYYYSKPIKVSFESQPFDINQLTSAKLRKGWNIISFPAYLSSGELKLGNCIFEKSYVFEDEMQQWVSIPVDRLDKDWSYMGGGFAIKVSDDCTLLSKKGEESSQPISPPPAIPN